MTGRTQLIGDASEDAQCRPELVSPDVARHLSKNRTRDLGEGVGLALAVSLHRAQSPAMAMAGITQALSLRLTFHDGADPEVMVSW